MKKYILAILLALPSVSHAAFTTDWLRNTSSSITVNNTTYTWNAGAGGGGQFLQNINGVITSAIPAGGGGGSTPIIASNSQVLYSTGSVGAVGDNGLQYDNLASSLTIGGRLGARGSGEIARFKTTTFGSQNTGLTAYEDSFGVTGGFYGFDHASISSPLSISKGFVWQGDTGGGGSGVDEILRIESVFPYRIALRKGSWALLSTTTVKLYDADSSNYTSFRASDTIGTSIETVYPSAVPSIGQVRSVSNVIGATVYESYSTISGGSTLVVGTGTAANFVTAVTSPTAVISVLPAQISLTTIGTTSFWQLNGTSVTLQGQSVLSFSSAAATYLNKLSPYVSSVNVTAALTVTANGTAGSSPQIGINASSVAVLSGGLIPNALIDGSSITKQGLLVAGSNITLTPGAGTLTIASSGSGGVSTSTGPVYASTNTATIANTTSESSFSGVGIGASTITANTITVGKSYLLHAAGYFSTLVGVPGNLTFKVKVGTTTIVSATIAPSSGNNNAHWDLAAYLTFRSIGTSGSVICNPMLAYKDSTIVSINANGAPMLATSPVTINTTQDLKPDITATWATADSANTISATNFILDDFSGGASSSSGSSSAGGYALEPATITPRFDRGAQVGTVAISTFNANVGGPYIFVSSVGAGNQFGIAVSSGNINNQGYLAGIYFTPGNTPAVDLYAGDGTAPLSISSTSVSIRRALTVISTVTLNGETVLFSPGLRKVDTYSAGAGLCTLSSGCVSGNQFASTTSFTNYLGASFTYGTTSYWNLEIPLPENYITGSTFTAIIVWTSTAPSGNMAWNVQMKAVASGQNMDLPWGTAVQITDSLTSTGTQEKTSESSAITAANSPVGGQTLFVQVFRGVNGNDTMVGNAVLERIAITYLVDELSGRD